MMAALFLLMTILFGCIYGKQRRLAVVFLILTVGLCWLMLAHHATDSLKVMW